MTGQTPPTAIWGAGAKGVTFANHLDRERKRFNCVVDTNSKKQGKFLPGSGHEIVSPQTIKDRGIQKIVVMYPNYLEELKP